MSAGPIDRSRIPAIGCGLLAAGPDFGASSEVLAGGCATTRDRKRKQALDGVTVHLVLGVGDGDYPRRTNGTQDVTSSTDMCQLPDLRNGLHWLPTRRAGTWRLVLSISGGQDVTKDAKAAKAANVFAITPLEISRKPF